MAKLIERLEDNRESITLNFKMVEQGKIRLDDIPLPPGAPVEYNVNDTPALLALLTNQLTR